MDFEKNEWIGRWENFENYIDSKEPALQQTWERIENVCGQNPQMAAMFSSGVRDFWRSACHTVTDENTIRLGGWNIEEAEAGLWIEWFSDRGTCLGREPYRLERIVSRGLEGKENYLFFAAEAAGDWPFRWLLAMEPMPPRMVRTQGGLLSHLHFQFASKEEKLLKNGSLCAPRWYATMCDGTGTISEKCDIILALHRIEHKQ